MRRRWALTLHPLQFVSTEQWPEPIFIDVTLAVEPGWPAPAVGV
jgi:hypothetical protein